MEPLNLTQKPEKADVKMQIPKPFMAPFESVSEQLLDLEHSLVRELGFGSSGINFLLSPSQFMTGTTASQSLLSGFN